jgi:protein phosphatase
MSYDGMFRIDRRHDSGPFDIIGDVHGCAEELQSLLTALGYCVAWSDGGRAVAVTPPAGRKAIFTGDLVNRGPNTPDVLRIAMSMTTAGTACVVEGNNEHKLARRLSGRTVAADYGLDFAVEQLAGEAPQFIDALTEFLDALPSYVWLDGGRLAVAHAGLEEDMIGTDSDAVRKFALMGEPDWRGRYRGTTAVVHGHTPIGRPVWLNNTFCVDTGCVFGARLTALRWPEKEVVDVPARKVWFAPREGDAFLK